MSINQSFEEQAQAALERGEFTPLPDILRGYTLEISAYLDTLYFPERVPEEDEIASLVRDWLIRYEIIDITSDIPWRVGPLRCAWKSDEPGVLQGWRRLRLPGIENQAKADDASAPELHLSPTGCAFYEPGPLCLDRDAPALIPVVAMEQLIHLLERV